MTGAKNGSQNRKREKVMSDEERIGEGLVRVGGMTRQQVDDILERQRQGNDSPFGVMAIELGYVDENELLQYLESRGL